MNPLIEEIKTINNSFREFGVGARIHPTGRGSMIAPASHVAYGIQRAKGQRIGGVEKLLPELTEALTALRRRQTVVRLNHAPLSLEVEHPQRKTLDWASVSAAVKPHTMLAGRRYVLGQGPRDEVVSFSETPHVLVAGVTGAGKSVMMSGMLATLAMSTSPSDLRILLIDLKNEDMLPFRNLPHVQRFAGRMEEAEECIAAAIAELDKRIDQVGYKPFRLVLWIDEVAELANNSAVKESLGRLASAGRSKDINLVCATTYPTEKGGLGALMKANFPIRLVGMVASGQSYTATQRPKLHADLLPGRGSFLRVQGNDAPRFQSFFMTESQLDAIIGEIGVKWGKNSDISGYIQVDNRVSYPDNQVDNRLSQVNNQVLEPDIQVLEPDNQVDIRVSFPIGQLRDLTDTERAEVAELSRLTEFRYAGKPSLSKLSIHVFGSKDPERMQIIKDALPGGDSNIIRLSDRRAA